MRPVPADARAASRRPIAACVVVDADATHAPLSAKQIQSRVRDALLAGAPAIVVLCAAGKPVLRARARLRALDRLLAPLAAEIGLRVSRSATDGLAAWAASREAPIGVDVQCAPAALEADLLDAALHADEHVWLHAQPDPVRAFTQLWAGKEAVLKAFGVGLAWSTREVLVLPVATVWHPVQVPALGHAWLTQLETAGAARPALAVALNAGHEAPGD